MNGRFPRRNITKKMMVPQDSGPSVAGDMDMAIASRSPRRSPHGFVLLTNLPTLKLTASLPLNIGHPKRMPNRIPTIHFQVRTVSFREGKKKTQPWTCSRWLEEKVPKIFSKWWWLKMVISHGIESVKQNHQLNKSQQQ